MGSLRRIMALLCCAAGLTTCRSDTSAYQIPAGYPASYADRMQQADREGDLEIWSAIDQKKAAPLVAGFSRLHPDIRVHYAELPASEIYQKFRARADVGRGTVDFLWSSAMDLQIKLVNDGYAKSYVSPERANLPHWANWKDQAWGTTAEPIVFLYNRHLISDDAMPRGHEALLRFLESRPAMMHGRFGTYDVRSSAVGYLYLSQDAEAEHDIWRFVRAIAANKPRLFGRAEEMVQQIADGRLAMGYDIVGSYALEQAERNADLGMIVPRDYTLLMSRIAVIPAAASHPAAAELFLDYLLSRPGQKHLVAEDMPSVRDDVTGPPRLSADGIPLRAIRVGPALLVTQDQLTRQFFLRRWQTALQEGGDAKGG